MVCLEVAGDGKNGQIPRMLPSSLVRSVRSTPRDWSHDAPYELHLFVHGAYIHSSSISKPLILLLGEFHTEIGV